MSTSLKKIQNEPKAFGRIPLSTIRKSTAIITSTSPGGSSKPTSATVKRNSSTISLGNIFPRRKSQQTTALATRRQSLWMNIAKNAPVSNDIQPPVLPLRNAHSSLMRRKLLRLLLVFSYLLSISLLAIALATFYGFFWSGYSTTVPEGHVIVRSLPNRTVINEELKIERDLS